MENKEIKISEGFAGYGSQRVALENIGHKIDEDSSIIEWAADAIIANAAVHNNNELIRIEKIALGSSKEQLVEHILNWTLSTEKKKVEGNYVPIDQKQYKRMSHEYLAKLVAANSVTNNIGSILEANGQDPYLLNLDLFTYSFPCQDLSIAGNQKGITKTSRSGLLYQVERILLEQDFDERPKYLLLENVKQLVGKKFKPDFDEWLEVLDELGYNTSWTVLNAKEQGVAQNRERVFALSMRKDLKGNVPDLTKITKKPLEKRLKDYLEKEVDESYYLSDDHIMRILNWKAYEKPLAKVMFEDTKTMGTFTTRCGDDTSSQKLIMVVGNVSPSNHGQGGNVYSPEGIAPTFTENHGSVMKVIEKDKVKILREEDNNINVDEIFKGKHLIMGINEGSPKYKSDNIIHGEDYIVSTLRAGGTTQLVAIKIKDYENYFYIKKQGKDGDNFNGGGQQGYVESIIPLRIRKITPKEALRLMGLDDIRINNIQHHLPTKSTQYKLAGNSIVIPVLEEIFKLINFNA